MINPYKPGVKFVQTSPFGMRWGQMHTGQDFASTSQANAPIVAVESGKIIRASIYGGYGNCVDIQHANGLITRYGHLSNILVRVGQYVQVGHIIGLEGSTGLSTGSHLHFEVIKNGVAVNPLPYLNGNAESTSPNIILLALLYFLL